MADRAARSSKLKSKGFYENPASGGTAVEGVALKGGAPELKGRKES